MEPNIRQEQLVRAVGGDPVRVVKDYNGGYQYGELTDQLDIRISNHELYDTPWVDIYHRDHGPVALYRVQDDQKAADLINEYKEVYRGAEAASAH